MLWSKQFYHYVVRDWLEGDPLQPPPPTERAGRAQLRLEARLQRRHPIDAGHWEYPWFAAWDLAFHCVPMSLIDPDFAKHQLLLLTREWYMHPNGQIAGVRVGFRRRQSAGEGVGGVRIFQIERKMTGPRRDFLERVFQKLLLNFTWWVNRKDAEGRNVFQGGFLASTTSAYSTVARRCRPAVPRSVRRHDLDGRVLAEHAGDRARTRRRNAGLRGHRLEVLRALPLHRRRDEQDGREDYGFWDEEDGFYYDFLHCRAANAFRSRSARWSASSRCWRSRCSIRAARELPRLRETHAVVLANRPDLRRKRRAHEIAASAISGCSRSSARQAAWCASCARMLDEAEFLSRIRIAHSRGITL